MRRELLIQQVDPRSPERGQYAFVQALIREVAYNTLSKRDRKVRHLAAARFFETLETDELAGALAGHYLAAHGYAAEGPEADALAAQARVALRGAAERAAALGSHQQAIAFLEHALAVSPDAVDRADLYERARVSAMQGLSGVIAERLALGALEAQRELGDRPAIAMATANYAFAIQFFVTDAERLLGIMLPAWEEFQDLEETPAGVALMLLVAAAQTYALEDQIALGWIERALPIAERLDLLELLAVGLQRMSGILWRLERPRQSLIILRGVHEMAVANGLTDVDRNSRTSLTFYEQFLDPRAGLAAAREGLDIAGRVGSLNYGFLMVGNACQCAMRTGEWDWAAALLDDWLSNEITGGFFLELFVDRAILTALRGGDPAADIAEAERLVVDFQGDSQYPSYVHLSHAWAAFVEGRFDEATTQAVAAIDLTNFFAPISGALAVRAALWDRDAAATGSLITRLEGSVFRGGAFGLDVATLKAGLAALEGRRPEAIAGYRDAFRGWRQLGCAFDEAMAVLDMVQVLAPTEREMAEAPAAIEWARETFTRIGATPFVARLEAALSGSVGASASAPASAPAAAVGTASEVGAER